MHHEEVPAPNHLAISDEDYKHHKSEILKTTALLSFITVFEVIFAIVYEKWFPTAPMLVLRIGLVVMSLLKAGYIMAVFMHVKHEKRMMILTIFIPFTLLIWMIIAFMLDGTAWHEMRHLRFPVK
ncbi:MAG: cytochrome C oxidase subunit IV family protein [Bacteroidetes bacterium]|nr:cytochrome C oxidase subunit IV family protein [Bacteroidota bacterium]